MTRSGLWVLSGALLLWGCADDGEADTGSGTDGSNSSPEDDGPSDDDSETDPTEPSDTEDPETSADSVTGEPPVEEDVPARAVSISRVEANPGVAIPVAENGAWVDGPDRKAQIPKNRNTAFRVYLDVDDDAWIPRNIEARMRVVQTDGTETVYSEVGEVANDSSETSFQSNIVLGVLAEDMQPGARFNIELYEAGGDYQSLPEESEPPTALPDLDLIGIEGTYQNMRIMIVPIDYDFGGCTTQFDVGEENLSKYVDSLFQQNGVENIDVEIHPYMVVNDLDLGGNGFFQLLNRVSQLRASEAPDPNVYYYGLFDNCGACIGDGDGCTLGVANGIPDASMGSAGGRAAIGTQFLGSNEVGIETFVHEIGHTQGRRHIACPNATAAGTNPQYPYPDGKTEGWGFGVRDFQLRNGNTHYDYMSYCNPTWVSDWEWKETFLRIQELSSWEGASMEDEMAGRYLLAGSVNTQTGEAIWWTDRGWVEESQANPNNRVRFEFDDASVEDTLLVDVEPWSEGPWVSVRAPLPERFDALTQVQLDTPSLTTVTPRNEITVHHLNAWKNPQ